MALARGNRLLDVNLHASMQSRATPPASRGDGNRMSHVIGMIAQPQSQRGKAALTSERLTVAIIECSELGASHEQE